MRKIDHKIDSLILVILSIAYLSYTVALFTLFIQVKVFFAQIIGTCLILAGSFFVLRLRKRRFFSEEQLEASAKLVQINSRVAVLLFLVFGGFVVTGIPARSVTSFAFATLGMALVFGYWWVNDTLALHFIDQEIEKQK